MGVDRTGLIRLEESPTRPQTHRPADPGRTPRRVQRAPLRQPHGNPWKHLPHDSPNHGTVYAHYATWRDEGILAQLNYDLTGLAHAKEGRNPEPTASVIDTRFQVSGTVIAREHGG